MKNPVIYAVGIADTFLLLDASFPLSMTKAFGFCFTPSVTCGDHPPQWGGIHTLSLRDTPLERGTFTTQNSGGRGVHNHLAIDSAAFIYTPAAPRHFFAIVTKHVPRFVLPPHPVASRHPSQEGNFGAIQHDKKPL